MRQFQQTGYRVTRDGVTVATFPDEAGAWAYLLNAQSQSVDWACRHEGWNIIYPDGSVLRGASTDLTARG